MASPHIYKQMIRKNLDALLPVLEPGRSI